MLAGWAETHNSGAKIALWLPDSADLDVFRGLTVRKGNTAGHRFMMVLVEIGEDEKPVSDVAHGYVRAGPPIGDPPGLEGRDPPGEPVNAIKGGELAKLAGILCATPQFRDWLFARVTHPAWTWARLPSLSIDRDQPEESAARLVRLLCEIRSRAELDHDAAAAARFHECIRKPYHAHLEEIQA